VTVGVVTAGAVMEGTGTATTGRGCARVGARRGGCRLVHDMPSSVRAPTARALGVLRLHLCERT